MRPAAKGAAHGKAGPGKAGAGVHRRALISKVKIAQAQLGLDDATYRAVIGRLFRGKSSSTQLSDAQLGKLVDHFVSEGFKPSRPRRAGARPMAAGAVARKVRALWITLHQAGGIDDPSEEALAAWVERTTGLAALQWVDAAAGAKAIEGLKAMLRRAEERRGRG